MIVPGGPPADLHPADLFALLVAVPRPSEPLRRAPGWAEGLGLRVRAITAREEATARAGAAVAPPYARGSVLADALLVAALWTPTGPALAGPADLGGLDREEAEELLEVVTEGLARVSPSYARVDVRAWDAALLEGARQPANLCLALALGQCMDISGWGAMVPRPDRFFGAPIGDMTDGQWMAFRAARALIEELSK